MKWPKNRFPIYCLLFIISIIGGFLRFYNLNWDSGFFFHPDERNLDIAVSKIRFFSQLNPQFFAYGSFPIYLYRFIGGILSAITKDSRWVSDWSYINLVSRGVSAFFSTITIFLVFLVAKKIWDEKIGLLSAFFTTFTVSLIQTAHHGVTESMLVFWLILTTLLSLNIIQKPTLKNYLKIGVILGLASATKISALSFLLIPTATHLLYYFKTPKNHLKFLTSLLLVFLVFTIFSPYVFLDYPKFLESMNYETGVVTGRLKVVYVLQFEKTSSYFFQIKNLFWQTGLTTLPAILGVITVSVHALLRRERKSLILTIFLLAYFLYTGSWYTKFIRYMVPLLPFLNIFAAWLLVKIWNRHKKLGLTLITLTTLTTLLWALAFFSIYTRESTRITASKWIYQNIPKNTKILTEHWDDGLPLPLISGSPSWYQNEQLTIYEPDNQQKINYYAEKLSEADYIIINSRRLYGTLINLPEKYPITSRYYKFLFSGKLGYTKIAEFSSYPEIFGIKINDDASEETFQVYEHPKVIIFKNMGHFSQETLIKNFL